MSKLSMDQLRAAYAKPTQTNNLPNNYYSFWNMAVGDTCEIRFLPDANDENPLGFMVEKKSHALQINGQRKTVPCLSMYGEECPICKVSAEYYKAGDKVNGKKYYRSVQYLTQALVLDNPITPKDGEEDPTGKVKLLSLNYSIHQIIKDAFESELEAIPYDFDEGTNFTIKKTQQGEYASYTMSKFNRRETALTEDEQTVANEGMIDLKTVLPKNPGYDKVAAMLEADLSGGEYVEPSSETKSGAPAAESKSVVEESTSKVEAKSTPAPAASTGDDDDVDDLLAAIQARKAAMNG